MYLYCRPQQDQIIVLHVVNVISQSPSSPGRWLFISVPRSQKVELMKKESIWFVYGKPIRQGTVTSLGHFLLPLLCVFFSLSTFFTCIVLLLWALLPSSLCQHFFHVFPDTSYHHTNTTAFFNAPRAFYRDDA